MGTKYAERGLLSTQEQRDEYGFESFIPSDL